MISLEVPPGLAPFLDAAHQVAEQMLRPISRKYDAAEHTYPVELDELAALIDAVEGSGSGEGASAGGNLAAVLSILEMCWGDVGLLLSLPRRGLGNSAIAAIASPEQKARLKGTWAAMAMTEPTIGSDTARIRTSAVRDGDFYVLNGEKIYVTSGDRADSIVVWATVDRSLGRAGMKPFLVTKDMPGVRVERLESKLGIRASDTAAISLTDCRVPVENLLGDGQGFADAMVTFDNTRPLVAAMALGCARAALDRTRELLTEAGVEIDYDAAAYSTSAVVSRFVQLEADWEGAYLLTLQSAWLADQRQPNSMQASMAKAKAGRVGSEVTLGCIELCGAVGYGETELLEKWGRDSKILDIFEGTQQIQLLIVARRLLGLTSAELK